MPALRAIAVAVAAAALWGGSAQAASIGRCGGGGGPQSAQLSCPEGQYVVRLSATGGDYVDRIGIRCASFNAAGARSALGHSASAGGGGGSESATGTCPGNRAVASIWTFSGDWLDVLGSANCAQRRAAGGFGPLNDGTSVLMEFDVGGDGGRLCHLICPAGQAVHKITVRYGWWIDSIEVFCRP